MHAADMKSRLKDASNKKPPHDDCNSSNEGCGSGPKPEMLCGKWLQHPPQPPVVTQTAMAG
jgi:hypothetical protein